LQLIVVPKLQVVAGDITTQPKQSRQSKLMSSLSILLRLCFFSLNMIVNLLWFWKIQTEEGAASCGKT